MPYSSPLSPEKLRQIWEDVLAGGFDAGEAGGAFILTFPSKEALQRFASDEPGEEDRVRVERLDNIMVPAAFPKSPETTAAYMRAHWRHQLVGYACRLDDKVGSSSIYTDPLLVELD